MGKSNGFGPKTAYLVLYNAASAIAWATVLGRVALMLNMRGPSFVPLVVDNFARITQTCAVMEILHALTGEIPLYNQCFRECPGANAHILPGVVPAPVFTTVMQVASRLFLMWAVCYPFPELNISAWYSSMLCAWSVTEVIRYTYFALKQFEAIPGWLHWLRYSAFLILYPIGISSEVAMTLQALFGPAQDFVSWYPYALGAVLLSYIPGERDHTPEENLQWRH